MNGALIIGDALVDIVPEASGPHDYVGGSPLNVAVGLGRLGRPVTLAAWIGRDARGQAIRQHCAASAVALMPGSDGAERTSTAAVSLDEHGHAQYVFDFSSDLAPIPEYLQPRLLHTGSVGSALQPGGQRILDLFQANPYGATVSYDPNVRPAIMAPPAELRPWVESFVTTADLVKASDEDVKILYGAVAPVEVARAWLDLGPAFVCITQGGAGAFVVTRSGVEVHTPARPAVVVDTVGAGDSFMAGIIDGLWEQDLLGPDRRAALGKIDAPTVARILDHASRISAITVSRAGANPPWREELGIRRNG